MEFNIAKVRANVRMASTEDLLDRATVWRYGMEPEALDLIEAELRNRGFGATDVELHAKRRAREVVIDKDAVAAVCCKCARPAIERRWVWSGFWGLLPLFPRRAYVCAVHGPGQLATSLSRRDQRPPA
jgi:hypothetical protein